MQLQEYLEERGLTDRSFAAKLGVASMTVWRWRNGRRTPRIPTIKRIAELTGGAVTATDWLEVQS